MDSQHCQLAMFWFLKTSNKKIVEVYGVDKRTFNNFSSFHRSGFSWIHHFKANGDYYSICILLNFKPFFLQLGFVHKTFIIVVRINYFHQIPWNSFSRPVPAVDKSLWTSPSIIVFKLKYVLYVNLSVLYIWWWSCWRSGESFYLTEKMKMLITLACAIFQDKLTVMNFKSVNEIST